MAATPKQLAALKKGRKTLAARRRREKEALGLAKPKKKRTTVAKTKTKSKGKKKSGGGGKRRHSGGGGKRRRGGGGSNGLLTLNKTDCVLAGATVILYGYLQHRASEAKGDDMKWFKEMKTITPVGRAGTIAAVGVGATLLSPPKIRKWIKGPAIGMTFVTGGQLARRGFTLYTDKDVEAIIAGVDEAQLGGLDDALALGGELRIEGGPGDDALQALLDQMMDRAA